MKKVIKTILRLPDQVYNKLIFMRRKPVCKHMPDINGKIYMVSDKGAVSFGENVRINSSLESNPIGGSTRTILYAKPKAKIVIGNHVGISNSCVFAAESIKIGDDVLIGGDCRIYDSDFHSIEYSERMKPVDTSIGVAPVEIGNGVFIGTHCLILKGVKIGERSVVAAGSVVTKSIPSGELWGGVPAEFIRKL